MRNHIVLRSDGTGNTKAGLMVIRRFEGWGRRNSTYFVYFAAGVLITVSFLHIIPKSFSLNQNAPVFLFCGYIGLYLFNRFMHLFACDKRTGPDYGIGLVSMLGIGLHSIVDGIIYSVTFAVSVFTGVLAATGMVLHEFPKEIDALRESIDYHDHPYYIKNEPEISGFFKQKENRKVLDRLAKMGVKVDKMPDPAKQSALEGRTFVLIGSYKGKDTKALRSTW